MYYNRPTHAELRVLITNPDEKNITEIKKKQLGYKPDLLCLGLGPILFVFFASVKFFCI